MPQPCDASNIESDLKNGDKTAASQHLYFNFYHGGVDSLKTVVADMNKNNTAHDLPELYISDDTEGSTQLKLKDGLLDGIPLLNLLDIDLGRTTVFSEAAARGGVGAIPVLDQALTGALAGGLSQGCSQ